MSEIPLKENWSFISHIEVIIEASRDSRDASDAFDAKVTLPAIEAMTKTLPSMSNSTMLPNDWMGNLTSQLLWRLCVN